MADCFVQAKYHQYAQLTTAKKGLGFVERMQNDSKLRHQITQVYQINQSEPKEVLAQLFKQTNPLEISEAEWV